MSSPDTIPYYIALPLAGILWLTVITWYVIDRKRRNRQ